jgi:8-oxo-dGTP pyrophosphatase MutT (NUDIX family)
MNAAIDSESRGIAMLQDALGPDEAMTTGIEDVEQAAAICINRCEGTAPQVLLVRSRRNGRWGLPKGHIELGETAQIAAAREAFEEAGVRGSISSFPLGKFFYFKNSTSTRYNVTVYVLDVQSISDEFPEKGVRKSRWVSIDQAVLEASQPGLRTLLQKI